MTTHHPVLLNNVEFQKKNKERQFQDNFLTEEWTDVIYRTLLDHGHWSNKRISQLRVMAVDNKNKIQCNSAYHTILTYLPNTYMRMKGTKLKQIYLQTSITTLHPLHQ